MSVCTCAHFYFNVHTFSHEQSLLPSLPSLTSSITPDTLPQLRAFFKVPFFPPRIRLPAPFYRLVPPPPAPSHPTNRHCPRARHTSPPTTSATSAAYIHTCALATIPSQPNPNPRIHVPAPRHPFHLPVSLASGSLMRPRWCRHLCRQTPQVRTLCRV